MSICQWEPCLSGHVTTHLNTAGLEKAEKSLEIMFVFTLPLLYISIFFLIEQQKTHITRSLMSSILETELLQRSESRCSRH